MRNALWVTWLRRPLRVALAESARFVREADSWRALGAAFAGVPWCVRHRRVLPRHVEGWCRRIDAQARRLARTSARATAATQLR
ncbi:MAG TPA: hypothetical protein VNO26_03665 [Candidatus Limnocylindria bacterium]|nr:hypothetical protein [Candidatus Limnocylindria bacterium]